MTELVQSLKIISATIVRGMGADKIILHTNLPEACYPYTSKQSFSFNAAQGSGVLYVTKHLGVSTDVVEMPSRTMKFGD